MVRLAEPGFVSRSRKIALAEAIRRRLVVARDAQVERHFRQALDRLRRDPGDRGDRGLDPPRAGIIAQRARRSDSANADDLDPDVEVEPGTVGGDRGNIESRCEGQTRLIGERQPSGSCRCEELTGATGVLFVESQNGDSGLRHALRQGESIDSTRAKLPVRHYERDLRALEDAFPMQPGQCGAVLGLGRDLCLDVVSRPDAFVRLWPKLRAGYLLDALGHLDRKPIPFKAVPSILGWVSHADHACQPSVGLGTDVRIRGEVVIGSGLELEGELLQLSAFTSRNGGSRAFGRIARPSVRR